MLFRSPVPAVVQPLWVLREDHRQVYRRVEAITIPTMEEAKTLTDMTKVHRTGNHQGPIRMEIQRRVTIQDLEDHREDQEDQPDSQLYHHRG